ncbi:MAG TPA: hypothetical protein VGO11_00505 [Chthoniobacteraceae bacterium]|nr:hypothetical protein [Chthoniobacteraceae bacterium]
MNRTDAAILVLRAAALYAFFQAFGYLPMYAAILLSTSWRAASQSADFLLYFFLPASWLALGAFLFVRSRNLAALLLPPPDLAADDAPPVHPVGLASAAFAVIGLAVVLYALPHLLKAGFSVALIGPLHDRELRFDAVKPEMLGLGAQVVLGFLLFLKARAFATVWWRKQAPPAPKAPPEV